MTTTAHPIASPHRIVTALVAAALAVGLTFALLVALTSPGSGTPVSRPGGASARVITESAFRGTVNSRPDNPTRVVSTLCTELANAAPGSPADFQLAQSISIPSSC